MRSSFRLRLWLIYGVIDLPFSAAVPLAYGAMVGLKWGTDEASTIASLLIAAYAVKTAAWTALMAVLLAPVDNYLKKTAQGATVSDAELVDAGAAAYRYVFRFVPFYALLWGGQYMALFLDTAALPLVLSAGIGTIIFSVALCMAAGVLNTSINGFLLAPIAGRISLDAQQRRLEIPVKSSSFRRLLVFIALFLTLAPIGWMGSAGYVFDVRAGARDRSHATQTAAQSASLALWQRQAAGERVTRDVVGVVVGAVPAEGDPVSLFAVRDGELVAADAVRALLETASAEKPWRQGPSGNVADRHSERVIAWERGPEGWTVGAVASLEPRPSAAFVFTILFYFAIGLVFAPVVAFFIGAGVAAPVGRIADALRSIMSRGELAGVGGVARVPIPSKDEIGVLATCANEMIEKLEDYASTNRAQLKELETKNQQLVEAAQAKSQFLASMSHELRTPLNAIIGFSRMVLKKTEGMIPEQQARNLKLINESGQALLALVNDLLDFERIETGRMKVVEEEVDCVALAQTLSDTLRPAAEARGLTLAVKVADPPLSLRTDPDRLRQIVVNFMNNAIKYSDKGHIEVTFARAPSSASVREVRISVADQGIGIPPGQLAKIFEPFHQVDGSFAREREGVGLGLAIVKKLAHLLGGDVDVQSELGKGSTFTLVLPLKALVERRAVERVMPPQGTGPVVLVIDDELAFLEIARNELSEAGYRVHVAKDGAEGIEKAESLQPDTILLDIHMPGMDGWEVMRKLRDQKSTAHIPVIVSSVSDDETKQTKRSLDVNIAAWLTKPLDAERVKEAMARLKSRPGVADALVVEDDDAGGALVSEQLKDLGLRVRRARNGDEALTALVDRMPDVMVLDLTLPGKLDGFAVLEGLRARPDGKCCHVIVYTARDLSAADQERITKGLAVVVKKHGASGLDGMIAALKERGVSSSAPK